MLSENAPAVDFLPVAPNDTNTVRVGVIGYGYWGPNIVRNFQGQDQCDVVALCDKSPDALRRARRVYPNLHMTTDFSEILQSPAIDAVAIVTPVWTHLRAGQGRARERQACLRGETVHLDVSAGGGTDRAGRAEEPEDHGRSHVPVLRGGAEDPRSSSTTGRWVRCITSTRPA